MSNEGEFFSIFCRRGPGRPRKFNIMPQQGLAKGQEACGWCGKNAVGCRCRTCGERVCHGCSTYAVDTGDACPGCENKRRIL